MAMTLRLTDEQDRRLTERAEAQGISKQEAVIRALDRDSERAAVAGEVKDWADYALTRYASLLDRLAQ
ncbi:CopG family transcriptional regulator [Jatrophihabitans fulvus]